MQTAQRFPHDSTMSVNVALCGSIPRSLHARNNNSAPPSCALSPRLSKVGLADPNRYGSTSPTHNQSVLLDALPGLVSHHHKNSSNNNSKDTTTMRPVLAERQAVAHVFEAPSWAVPAKGEARLEPVCEGLGRQAPVDLTSKAFFRIGRSPQCDVQLLHATSSRRHAMVFCHANGACYIVDCGSAHGTFVNGQRLQSPSNGGVVVPHKVRRGALIRFGGPGAPCFVLKAFSFCLGDLEAEPDAGGLVRRNTRWNALGRTAAAAVRGMEAAPLQDDLLLVTRKRSFDSLASTETLDEEEPTSKRLRCSSPPLSPEAPLRLVSPDLQAVTASKPRRVHFSADPPRHFYPALVTPEDSLSAEEDN